MEPEVEKQEPKVGTGPPPPVPPPRKAPPPLPPRRATAEKLKLEGVAAKADDENVDPKPNTDLDSNAEPKLAPGNKPDDDAPGKACDENKNESPLKAAARVEAVDDKGSRTEGGDDDDCSNKVVKDNDETSKVDVQLSSDAGTPMKTTSTTTTTITTSTTSTTTAVAADNDNGNGNDTSDADTRAKTSNEIVPVKPESVVDEKPVKNETRPETETSESTDGKIAAAEVKSESTDDKPETPKSAGNEEQVDDKEKEKLKEETTDATEVKKADESSAVEANDSSPVKLKSLPEVENDVPEKVPEPDEDKSAADGPEAAADDDEPVDMSQKFEELKRSDEKAAEADGKESEPSKEPRPKVDQSPKRAVQEKSLKPVHSTSDLPKAAVSAGILSSAAKQATSNSASDISSNKAIDGEQSQKPVVRFETPKPENTAAEPASKSSAESASVLPRIVTNTADLQSLADKSAVFLKSVFSSAELPKLPKPFQNGSAPPMKPSPDTDDDSSPDFTVSASQIDLEGLDGPTLLAPGAGRRPRYKPGKLVIEGSCNYFFWMEKIAMVSLNCHLDFFQG